MIFCEKNNFTIFLCQINTPENACLRARPGALTARAVGLASVENPDFDQNAPNELLSLPQLPDEGFGTKLRDFLVESSGRLTSRLPNTSEMFLDT